MKPCSTRLAVALSVMALVGCTTTSITSKLNPERPQRSYKKVLVASFTGDFKADATIEKKLRSTLRYNGVAIVPADSLFFPGRQYTEQEVENKIKTSGVDAVLIITLTQAGTKNYWIPQTTITTSSGSAAASSNYSYASYWSSTSTVGGFNISSNAGAFMVQLYDIEMGWPVWAATVESESLLSKGHMFRSVASRITRKLLKDCMIKQND